MSNSKQYKTVSEYFDDQTETIKKSLITLKQCILKVAPNAIEMLNYNIPAYELIEGGKRDAQIMIAANKKSVGFYPHPTTMENFDEELKEYKRGKGSVQFSLEQPLPTELIMQMIEYRFNLLKKL